MNQSKNSRNRWFHIPINQTDPKHIRAVKHLVNLILFVVSIPVTLITLFLGVAVLMLWFCLSTPEDIQRRQIRDELRRMNDLNSRGL